MPLLVEIFSIDGLVNELNVQNPVPADKDEWVSKALENNFRLQAAQMRKLAAKCSTRRSFQSLTQNRYCCQ